MSMPGQRFGLADPDEEERLLAEQAALGDGDGEEPQPASTPTQHAAIPEVDMTHLPPLEPTLWSWEPQVEKSRLPAGYGFMAGFSGDEGMRKVIDDELARPERERRLAVQEAQQGEDLERKRAKESREAAEFEAKKPYLADLAKSGSASKNAYAATQAQKLQFARDEADPNSELSKTAASAVAQKYMAQAQLLAAKNPQIAKMLTDSANKMLAGGVSARMVKENLAALGSVAPQALGEASKAFDDTMQAQANARGWAGLKQSDEHFKAAQTGKITAKIEKDQEKLNEKTAGLNEQDELLRDVGEQKKNVNTGYFSNAMQQGLKKIGLESKEFDDLEATLAGVTNQIIKLQAGGNVTHGEAARMRQQLPSPDMDDQEFETKLDRVVKQIAIKKKNAAKEYQRKSGGEVRDSAPIGRELVQQQEGNPKAATTNTSTRFKIGDTATNKQGKKARWNGTAWEPVN